MHKNVIYFPLQIKHVKAFSTDSNADSNKLHLPTCKTDIYGTVAKVSTRK